MSGRAVGYYGPSDADVGCGCLVLSLGVAGAVVITALLLMMAVSLEGCSGGAEAGSEDGAAVSAETEAEANSTGSGQTDFAIDVTDSHAMHEAGLPTKTDVITWHIYGRWGYSTREGGVHTEHVFEDLPGGAAVWDTLYGLDDADSAFRFR